MKFLIIIFKNIIRENFFLLNMIKNSLKNIKIEFKMNLIL
jgi:hypothetical protein